jgi:Alpha/beta hydrolase domain
VENAAIVTDEIGNAIGGIRLPDLAVPTAVHSGTNAISPVAALAGESTSLTDELLSALYPDADAYLKAWNDVVDTIRAQGLILESDVDVVRAPGLTIAAARWCP